MAKRRNARKPVYPMYEKLFSRQAMLFNKDTDTQTMQKLFFSIRVTAYFRYLAKYDPHAEAICAELMRYSGCKSPADFADGAVDENATIYDMLKIASVAIAEDEWLHIGYFIVDMLLIRPFALYAEATNRFHYPSCRVPPPAPPPDDILDPDDTEMPF